MSHRPAASIKRGLREAIAHERGEYIDVKAIRSRMGMTQRAFATRFGFSLDTLKNWERGHRAPKGAARALLTVIAKRPEAVIETLGE